VRHLGTASTRWVVAVESTLWCGSPRCWLPWWEEKDVKKGEAWRPPLSVLRKHSDRSALPVPLSQRSMRRDRTCFLHRWP